MIDDSPDLQRRYRAPRAFGPMPGPRNIPASQRRMEHRPDEVTTSLSVSLEADPAELTRLLPPDTHLYGPAVLTVTVSRFENLVWLAGRGYPILSVTFPIEYRGGSTEDDVQGRYLAVIWEGLADPITTGRDELGFPKLPADIRGPLLQDVSAAGTVDADATWDGFRFLDLSAEGLTVQNQDWYAVAAAPLQVAAAPLKGTIVHRYVPSLVEPESADIDQLIYHALASEPPTVTDRLSGTGRFCFHHAQFADSPVQYPVVNILAGLSLSESGPATLTRTTRAPGSTPGGSTPRILGATTGRVDAPVPAGAVA